MKKELIYLLFSYVVSVFGGVLLNATPEYKEIVELVFHYLFCHFMLLGVYYLAIKLEAKELLKGISSKASRILVVFILAILCLLLPSILLLAFVLPIIVAQVILLCWEEVGGVRN